MRDAPPPDRPPLDHPTPDRPHRVYVAVTNHCNRACPWCSTCSSPAGSTWIDPDAAWAQVPGAGPFELQLEGGEPTLHPAFWELVDRARHEPRCTRLVVCTNGVALPRRRDRLRAWLDRLGAPVTLKLSINHHLLERDRGLLRLAADIAGHLHPDLLGAGGHAPPQRPPDVIEGPAAPARLLVLNVRLRRGEADDDAAVREAVAAAGLLPFANVFFLQRYGFAADRDDWEPPRLFGRDFTLVNPDGAAHGTDLVGRSEAMRALP